MTICGGYEGAVDISKLLAWNGIPGRLCIGWPGMLLKVPYSLGAIEVLLEAASVVLAHPGVWNGAALPWFEYVLEGVDWFSITGLLNPNVDFNSNGSDVSALKASRSALIWTCISGVDEGRQCSRTRMCRAKYCLAWLFNTGSGEVMAA